MRFDYSAVEIFLDYAHNKAELEEVMEHPAYQAIKCHADTFDKELSLEEIEKAVDGEVSNFYGLRNLHKRKQYLKKVLNYIRENEQRWTDIIEIELDSVIPREDKNDLVIYPVLGYDVGIGIDNCICLNLNSDLYLNDPQEFLYMGIHVSSHALYERVHGFPKVCELGSKESKISFFNTLLHTEGYAVFTSMERRKKDDRSQGKSLHPIVKDYLILQDNKRLAKQVQMYDDFREDMENCGEWSTEKFLQNAFGRTRFAHRIGCAMVNDIAEIEGVQSVWDAFYMNPDKFVERYDRMLDEHR